MVLEIAMDEFEFLCMEQALKKAGKNVEETIQHIFSPEGSPYLFADEVVPTPEEGKKPA